MSNVRNVGIVLALAAAVAFLPGAGLAANLLGWIVGVLFLGGLAWFAARMYREYRLTLYSLGDRRRALLYGAMGVAVLTVVATPRLWATSAGIIAWFALIAAASFAVFSIYRSSQTY